GRVVAELAGEEITEDAVIAASFARPATTDGAEARGATDGAGPGAGSAPAGTAEDAEKDAEKDAGQPTRPSNGVPA
ncbi:MAG TPA: hypothetical protein VF667_03650, partial [Pseudonocardia sp.]